MSGWAFDYIKTIQDLKINHQPILLLKIFRSARKQLLKDNKFKNYILYAIGEILLVMIGILLALQVNNWNETRKSKLKNDSILSTIANYFALDTLVANQVIKHYEVSQKNSMLIIKNVQVARVLLLYINL